MNSARSELCTSSRSVMSHSSPLGPLRAVFLVLCSLISLLCAVGEIS